MGVSHYDVFNGDADGLCALQQLRLAEPREGLLVTGPKRDIELLARVPAQAGDTVTVLDISLERNRTALQALLARGVQVQYFDHHFAGDVPAHAGLQAVLDPAADACTSLLVDRWLGGRHRHWAVVGAFGDNLPGPARSLARQAGISPHDEQVLRALGEAINYNAYGESEADLLVAPARLHVLLRPYADPLAFAAQEPVAHALQERQGQDLALASQAAMQEEVAGGTLVLLPDASWARRVQGAYANLLSQREPDRAHAVLCPVAGDGFVVSVRAPQRRACGADTLCLAFAGGGGRAAAAGIDRLPRQELARFRARFVHAFAVAT